MKKIVGGVIALLVIGGVASAASTHSTKTVIKTKIVAAKPTTAPNTIPTDEAPPVSTEDPATTKQKALDQIVADSGAADSATQNLKVGSSTSLTGNDDGEQMNVKLVAIHDGFTAGQFDTPDPGHRYVAVELALKNTGSVPYSDSPGNGSALIDRHGDQHDEEVVVEGPYQSSSDLHISSGDSRHVYVTFQVPNGVGLKQFQFTMDSGYADQTAEWNL